MTTSNRQKIEDILTNFVATTIKYNVVPWNSSPPPEAKFGTSGKPSHLLPIALNGRGTKAFAKVLDQIGSMEHHPSGLRVELDRGHLHAPGKAVRFKHCATGAIPPP